LRSLNLTVGRRAALIVLIWLAVAALLLRIASGGTLADWPHVYHEEPRLWVVVMVATAINVLLVVLMLIGRGRLRFLLSAGWAFPLAILAVLLARVGHTSGLAIGVLALAAVWLATGAISQGARSGR
jgi:hypothetical protein